MTKKGTIYITVTVLTCVLTLYFSQFHEGLSRSSSDWGVFADFVSGTLSPLLAFLNIMVFIDLTKSIEENRLSIEKDKDKEQELRHKRDIEHQKQMQLFQFRIEEIRRLDTVLENTFFSGINDYHANVPIDLVKTLSYLESFLRNKVDLFEFKSEADRKFLIELIKEGHKRLSKTMNNMADINYKVDKESMTQYLDFKANLIKSLYDIAFGRSLLK